LLKGQDEYWKFQQEATNRAGTSITERLISDFSFDVGDNRVRVRALNTAFLSRQREVQGQLWYPLEVLDASVRASRDKANDFSICIYHHPDKWLESNNANKFRQRTEAASDLILIGHQHSPEAYHAQSLLGDTTWYSAGAALQMTPDTSTGLCAVYVDFSEHLRRRVEFQWDGKSYLLNSDTQWKPQTRNATARCGYVISEKFDDYLNDPGNLIVHTQKKKVYLNDVYEPCRLRLRRPNLVKDTPVISATELPQFIDEHLTILIFGEAQSGKTTLAKQIFVQNFRANGTRVSVLLDGSDLKSSKELDVERWIKRAYEKQYSLPSFSEFRAVSPENRLLIVDSWHDAPGNESAKISIFRILEKWSTRIVLIADSWFQLEEFSTALVDGEYAISLTRLTIMPYSALQRTNIIERWIMLGRQENIGSMERVYAVDAAERLLDEMTMTGLLPKYPLHILSALQTLQAVSQSEPDMGSQGHLYDTLVDGTLKAMSRDAPEISINRQFIAVIAAELFGKEQPFISLENIETLNERYFADYAVKVDLDEFLEMLVLYRVLRLEDGNYGFRERYVYYYFVAEYFTTLLAKRQDQKLALQQLKDMASYLAYEEYAQVLMFVIYKTRNSELIDEVILNSQMIFENAKVCDLDKDMDFLNNLNSAIRVEAISGMSDELPSEDVETNRKELRKELIEEEDRPKSNGLKVQYHADLDEGAKLQHAFKSLQMMGRVLRNFPGTLEADTKRQLAGASYELGLRTLTMLSEGVQNDLPEAKVAIDNALREKFGNRFDEQQREKKTDAILTFIVVASSIVLVTSISSAIGSPKLRETYRQLAAELTRTPATDLIGLAIGLENYRDIPIDSIYSLEVKFKDKYVAYQVLRFIVWRRLVYLPTANRSIRQQICERFKITVTPPMIVASKQNQLQ
jgi:hypothetical protein